MSVFSLQVRSLFTLTESRRRTSFYSGGRHIQLGGGLEKEGGDRERR